MGGAPPASPLGSSSGQPSDPASESPQPPFRRFPSPSPPRNPVLTISTQDIIWLVAEGVKWARQDLHPREERIRTSRLKMTNPKTFNGKPSALFNIWWKLVTKYLGFYPETGEQQKITCVETLLTSTAKAWDLHRYDTFGASDSWANYSVAIRAECVDTREAANAQLKLSQLKYMRDIRAYMTEFRALNNYTQAHWRRTAGKNRPSHDGCGARHAVRSLSGRLCGQRRIPAGHQPSGLTGGKEEDPETS